MDLETYLIQNSVGRTAFATRIGVTTTALGRYLSRERYPRRSVLERIVAETDGAVQPNDFLQIEEDAPVVESDLCEAEAKSVSKTLYERDFHEWTFQQAALLRSRNFQDADVANIAEEIESMGRSEQNELVNRLSVLFLHLLKWRYQHTFRGNSWRLSIKEQRIQTARHLRKNPSLRSFLDEAIADAYALARLRAAGETGLAEDTFPVACPFAFAQAMADDFWPE